MISSLRFRLIYAMLTVMSVLSAGAQDTLHFRDGTFAVGTIRELNDKKVCFLQQNESTGAELMKKERSAMLDSVKFRSGLVYRKGMAAPEMLAEDWKRFAAYWEGRRLGEKKTDFTKTEIGLNYLGGVLVLGLPYPIYKAAFYKPGTGELSAEEAKKYLENPDFARGYQKGVRSTNMNALFPVYLAGVVSSLLLYFVFVPQPE
jgi:hypothetical protein